MTTSQPHVEPRYKRRLPCSMRLGESRYSGVVLNLSRTGLFIQTSASPQPGEMMELELRGRIALSARVVWQRKVSGSLRSIVEGGVGVQIRSAPEEYFQLLAAAAAHKSGFSDLRRPEEPAAREARPRPARERFRARLQRHDGPRSRSVEVFAGSVEEAERKALARVGSGWTVVEVERRA